MIPDTVRLKENGVVHFLVAGFHEIVIYNPGKTHDDVTVPPGETFINDTNNRFYQESFPPEDPPRRSRYNQSFQRTKSRGIRSIPRTWYLLGDLRHSYSFRKWHVRLR